MNGLHPSPRLIAFLAGAAINVAMSPCLARSPQLASCEQSVYHTDRGHLWNRLHDALFVRVGPDGRAYGQDRLEPLLWANSKHLLEERSHERVVAVLQEFLESNGEELIKDPLKRALLQRDLWLVFNWLEGDDGDFAKPELESEDVHTAKERLRRQLAAVIGRVALGSRVIRELPDNYTAAVASGEFASRFDPEHPDAPYLPPELFAADGPWVCVGRSDGPTAPQHLREDGTNRFTNSVFLVFLRLPAGRDRTIEYLEQLQTLDEPLLVRSSDDSTTGGAASIPNPRVPQFPKGTELALVRRMMVIDSSNCIAAAPLTESVQLRVIRGEIPTISSYKQANAQLSSARRRERLGEWQSFHEFRLSRAPLFAGRSGGLRAVGSDERDFKTGFNSHPWDEFERSTDSDQPFPRRNQQVGIKENCFACHRLPGVFSFNSLQNLHMAGHGDQLRPFPLSAIHSSQIAEAAIKWKATRQNWMSLRTLLVK